MGCYDLTCCVSGLPIADRERVIFFFVREGGDRSLAHTVFHDWEPASWPIDGCYDHYGRVRPLHKPNAVVDTLVESIALRLDPSEGYDPDNDEPYADLGELMDGCRLGTLRLSALGGPPWGPARLQLALIREDVWRSLLHGDAALQPHNVETPADFGRHAKRACERELGLANAPAFDPAHPERQSWTSIMQGARADRHPAARWIHDFDQARTPHTKAVLAHPDGVEALAEAAGELAFVFGRLQVLGYTLRPSSAAGPQHGEWGAHVAYHRMIATLAERRHAAQERERDGFDLEESETPPPAMPDNTEM